MDKQTKTLPLVFNRVDTGAYISVRDSMEPVITNSVPVGALSISDAFNNITTNNVSGAIEDLSSIAILPIGSVVINTNGDSPQGSGQTSTLQFDGKFTPSYNSTNGKKHKVSVLGVPFEINDGAGSNAIAEAFSVAARKFVVDNKIFSHVEYSASSPSIVKVTSIDTRPHNLPAFKVGMTCTVTVSVESPPKAGYGAWDMIGSVSQSFENTQEPIKLFYFKRIG